MEHNNNHNRAISVDINFLSSATQQFIYWTPMVLIENYSFKSNSVLEIKDVKHTLHV